MPGGTSTAVQTGSLGVPLPPELPRRGPSHRRPRQLPQSPFWEETGVFSKRSAG